jgi:hypothetical protein
MMVCLAAKTDLSAARLTRRVAQRSYFLLASGVVLGPGTAGVVGSFGRTGAGVIVSGLALGVGGADLSRSQADKDKAVTTIQVHRARRVMGNLVSLNKWTTRRFFHMTDYENVSRLRK